MAKRQMKYHGMTAAQTAAYYIKQMGIVKSLELFNEHLATTERRIGTLRVPAIRAEYERLVPWYKDVIKHLQA